MKSQLPKDMCTKNSAEQKRLLVLGGFAQHCEVILKAKSKGFYVIVVDYLQDSPGKTLADESHLISITDVDAIVALCKDRRVDGVMNYCIDPGQKAYQQICERLELPCYGTSEQFDVLTNKDLFYETCIKYGVGVVPRYQVDYETLSLSESSVEYPLIVKPADGRASKGITVCYDEEDLATAIKTAIDLSARKKVVVDKFMDCPEVCAKYFVCDGEIYLTSFSDTYTCHVEGQRAAINGKYYPSKYYEHFIEGEEVKLREMIRGLGIRNGPLSFTGFYDEGKFFFFDPSFRLGGAQQWRVEEYVNGIDVSECLTNFALTGTMGIGSEAASSLATDFSGNPAGQLFILVRTGEIGSITGVEEALAVDSVIGHYVSHKTGDIVSQFGTTDHVVLTIMMVADSKDKLRQDMLSVQGLIKIEDSFGDNMLLPQFDVNVI